MFRGLANLTATLQSSKTGRPQQRDLMLAACAWLVSMVIWIGNASASPILGDSIISSHLYQRRFVWAIAEAGASNQEGKKSSNQSNPDEESGALCVKRMDACYEDCKPSEAEPGMCNLNCTTDKICGMPLRMSYGQFLDLQVEMLAVNANNFSKASQGPQNAKILPAQPQASLGPRRRSNHHRPPGAQPKPAAGRPGAASAETGEAGNGGWRLSWPQLNWPRF
jgi:hypothetical protein